MIRNIEALKQDIFSLFKEQKLRAGEDLDANNLYQFYLPSLHPLEKKSLVEAIVQLIDKKLLEQSEQSDLFTLRLTKKGENVLYGAGASKSTKEIMHELLVLFNRGKGIRTVDDGNVVDYEKIKSYQQELNVIEQIRFAEAGGLLLSRGYAEAATLNLDASHLN